MKKTILLTFLTFVSLLAIALSCFLYVTSPKIAYVDIQQLYDQFDYKIELEHKLQAVTNLRQSTLDSLELELNILSRQLQTGSKSPQTLIDSFNLKKSIYINYQQKYDDEYSRLVKTYDESIYKQITQYVTDFGESSKYTYILGATGAGNLMYAKDGENITEEVLKYINNRYYGQPK